MQTLYRVYLVKKDININNLPLEGTYDSYIEMDCDIIKELDELFITNKIYDCINALFGPGDSEYISSERCKLLVKQLENLSSDKTEIRATLNEFILILLKAINNNSGVYIDW